MSDDSGEFVFVCGDLRRGGSQAFLMESAEFFAEGLVRGKLIVVDGCPGLIPRTWGGFVKGEIYRVTKGKREQLGDREVRAAGELAPLSGTARWRLPCRDFGSFSAMP